MAINRTLSDQAFDVPAVNHKNAFFKIGQLLQRETTTTTSLGFSNWEITAEMLGFTPDQIHSYSAKADVKKTFPGTLVLEDWASMGPDRTLFVLRQILERQERLDCVSVIDAVVREQTEMVLFVKIESDNAFELKRIETSTCSTLEECLRGKLQEMGGIKNFTIIGTSKNLSVGWNTTAGQFKGVLLTVKRKKSVSFNLNGYHNRNHTPWNVVETEPSVSDDDNENVNGDCELKWSSVNQIQIAGFLTTQGEITMGDKSEVSTSEYSGLIPIARIGASLEKLLHVWYTTGNLASTLESQETSQKHSSWLQEANNGFRSECELCVGENSNTGVVNEIRHENISTCCKPVKSEQPPALPPRNAKHLTKGHVRRSREDLTFDEAHAELHKHISWLQYKTNDEIEKIMQPKWREDGNFITWFDIRNGCLKISVSHMQKVLNFKIKKTMGRGMVFYFVSQNEFECPKLTDLLSHYKTTSLKSFFAIPESSTSESKVFMSHVKLNEPVNF